MEIVKSTQFFSQLGSFSEIAGITDELVARYLFLGKVDAVITDGEGNVTAQLQKDRNGDSPRKNEWLWKEDVLGDAKLGSEGHSLMTGYV